MWPLRLLTSLLDPSAFMTGPSSSRSWLVCMVRGHARQQREARHGEVILVIHQLDGRVAHRSALLRVSASTCTRCGAFLGADIGFDPAPSSTEAS